MNSLRKHDLENLNLAKSFVSFRARLKFSLLILSEFKQNNFYSFINIRKPNSHRQGHFTTKENLKNPVLLK